MCFDKTFNNRKPQAGAASRRAGRAKKFVENTRQHIRGNARTAIRDANDKLVVCQPNLHVNFRTGWGIVSGVEKQIGQSMLNQRKINPDQ